MSNDKKESGTSVKIVGAIAAGIGTIVAAILTAQNAPWWVTKIESIFGSNSSKSPSPETPMGQTQSPPTPPSLPPVTTPSESTSLPTSISAPPAASPLEGKYSLEWFQDADKNTSGCWKTGSIADLTISSDGFMQGHLFNNSPNHKFSGKVNSDGTWSATLLGGYQFSGTMKDGVLSGRYTAPNGNSNETTQCKGKVSGVKQQS